MYLVYNLQLIINPDGYGTNLLYEKADLLYFIGALMYVLAAARDDGFYPDFRVFGLLWRYTGLAWVAARVSARCRCAAPGSCLRRSRGEGGGPAGSAGAGAGAASLSGPESRALLSL